MVYLNPGKRFLSFWIYWGSK